MSYGQQQNPYYQGQPQGQGQDAGHGYGQANPYGGNYELQDYNNNNNNQYQQPSQQQSQRRVLSLPEFLERVKQLRSDIDGLDNNLNYIDQLHQRNLANADGKTKDQLEQYISQTQIRHTAIKDGIKGLERDLVNTTEGTRMTKKTQLDSLKTYFKSELDKYQSVERNYQKAYQSQIRRQILIVNPDASEHELEEAVHADWGNEGVFQAALKENRTGHATELLGNVRARHNELQRIEQTLAELAALYQELAVMVEEQDPVIQQAEENAVETVDNIEHGNQEIKKANEHARRARRLKWWCLLIVVIIIIVVALGVGLGICLNSNKCGGK